VQLPPARAIGALLKSGFDYGYCALDPEMVNARKINIYMPIDMNEELAGCSGCLRSDRAYSDRRLRPRDNLPPPAKAKALRLCCAEAGVRLLTNSDGGQVVGATARVEHLM
jgi:hypothetical protein